MDYKVVWTDGSKNLELFPFTGRVVPEENDDSVSSSGDSILNYCPCL
jgi:hypothetical protein